MYPIVLRSNLQLNIKGCLEDLSSSSQSVDHSSTNNWLC